MSHFQFVIHLPTRRFSCFHPHKLSFHWMMDVKMWAHWCYLLPRGLLLGVGGKVSSIIVTVCELRASKPQTMLLIDLSPERGRGKKGKFMGNWPVRLRGIFIRHLDCGLIDLRKRKLKTRSGFVLHDSSGKGVVDAWLLLHHCVVATGN